MVIHRLRNISSLAHMFPNLHVIRGQQLVHKFSLVITENMEMEEVSVYACRCDITKFN